MCSPSTPKYQPPPAPPEPPRAPRMVDSSVIQARRDEKAQLRRMAGRSGTVLTNPTLGMAQTGATGKTKLGE